MSEKEESTEKYGVIHEIGDLGGYTELSESESEAAKKAIKSEKKD